MSGQTFVVTYRRGDLLINDPAHKARAFTVVTDGPGRPDTRGLLWLEVDGRPGRIIPACRYQDAVGGRS